MSPHDRSYIAGQGDAERFLIDLSDCTTHPDQLHKLVRRLAADTSDFRLRGFCRSLQKALERAAR
jgi:hypothetical protein